ncbi:DUF2461 domain-containing protein [Negadavirga shengliensis]|uniref:DUF2461 domain-containing protein n=1 Tax=Negadavirga shengliensis TaxID=1389218 RepID=A0ABV9T8W6_9BACT
MSQQLLKFLNELSLNNNKEWMDSHKQRFTTIRGGFLKNVEVILNKLVELDPALSDLKPKDCIFRQNRDIRFSANKMPYKINLAAYFAAGGKKSVGPGYYLHLQPGESFIAGGIWMPSSDVLKKIRQEINYSGKELESILSDPAFKSYFGEIEGEKLKTSPKGFDGDHPYIHYLRYKSFIVTKRIPDQDVISENYVNLALQSFGMMKPFQDFLYRAVEEVEDGSGLL